MWLPASKLSENGPLALLLCPGGEAESVEVGIFGDTGLLTLWQPGSKEDQQEEARGEL